MLVAILLAVVIMCVAGRRRALVALLTASILVPPDQVLMLGSIHFPMLRVLGLFGLIRCLRAKFAEKVPIFSGGMTGIDKAFIALNLFLLVNGMLLWRVWAELVFQLGNLITYFGLYLLLRFLIRDSDDVKFTIKALATLAAPVAAIMLYEKFTGVNPLYSALGGFRAESLGSDVVRDGHFRAAGPFAISILAGTFGGVLFPLFAGLFWKEKSNRKYAVLGIAAALVISFSASSSTALFGLIGGIVGLLFWPLRRRMQIIRWGIVFVLVSLHLYMKSPVWHLISDIDLTGGSSSYHRYQLINQCIVHFWNWVLVGTKDYPLWGWDMWDLCNQYVALADQSGLIPLASMIAIIVLGFRYLAKARRLAASHKERVFIWTLNASLFANVVAFFGISYYDQTIVVWYALLAMIHATAFSVRKSRQQNTVIQPDNVLVQAVDVCGNEVGSVPSFAS